MKFSFKEVFKIVKKLFKCLTVIGQATAQRQSNILKVWIPEITIGNNV